MVGEKKSDNGISKNKQANLSKMLAELTQGNTIYITMEN